MRSHLLGNLPGVSESFSKEDSLKIFSNICLCRSFEKNTAEAFNKKLIKGIPVYLSLGQESATAGLSLAMPNAKKFGQHRCHDIYLCWGGSPKDLRDELLGLPAGCSGGMGGSASIHSLSIGMFGHDGLMGTQVPIAVGYALGSGQETIAIMGDASAEEGYVLGAIGEAATKKAPVLFFCYDNNFSILTKVSVRRNWSLVNEAKAKNMEAIDIADDPWLVAYYAKRFSKNLPALINVRVCRELWHSGTGCDGPPEWNRYGMVLEEMKRLGLIENANAIEQKADLEISRLWQEAGEKK